MKVRDVIRLLQQDGWRHVRTGGSHRQFQHLMKPGTVTVSGKLGRDIPPGTLHSILKSSGLNKD
jgi:predicted RNA binding protein YcfA (HicA-like mRNA interferase family)